MSILKRHVCWSIRHSTANKQGKSPTSCLLLIYAAISDIMPQNLQQHVVRLFIMSCARNFDPFLLGLMGSVAGASLGCAER